jgi:hypothetical protein
MKFCDQIGMKNTSTIWPVRPTRLKQTRNTGSRSEYTPLDKIDVARRSYEMRH